MATLGRSAPRLRAAVTSRAPALPSLAGLAPSRLTGALAILAVVVGAGVGAYLLVRSTPVFAVRGIEVRGASPEVAREVRAALDPLLGANLVGLDGRRVRGALADVPDVAASSYDRGFPSTLRVWVVPERPVAVLRRGAERWLVSTRGRVLRPLDGAGRGLGRVWIPADAPLADGDTLTDPHVRGAVRALAVARAAGFPARVSTVRFRDELTLVLPGGLELRLGDGRYLALKLEVARRVKEQVAPDPKGGVPYIDTSVVARPVAGVESQVEGRG